MLEQQQRVSAGLWAAVAGVSLALAQACASAPPKQPNPTRPLDQQLALQVIADAISAEGDQPMGARPIMLPRGQRLIADVGVVGHQFAVAFITGEERQTLGPSVPAHDVGSTALQLIRDANQRETRVLVLHDLNYMTDEQTGEARDVSSIVAERRLQRDVRDFIAEAHRQQWP